MKSAGVDVVNMANNHALDYGPVGMQDTFDAIAASKLPVIGIGHNAAEAYRPYRTVIKGQRIAIFGALDWLEPGLDPGWEATETQPGVAFSIDRTRLVAAVRAVRPEVDTLVVFLHWGTEETHCASPEQEDLANALLAAGADIVVGSHAHRVFGAGHLGTAFVAYGLGNFVYWREDGESGRSGVLQRHGHGSRGRHVLVGPDPHHPRDPHPLDRSGRGRRRHRVGDTVGRAAACRRRSRRQVGSEPWSSDQKSRQVCHFSGSSRRWIIGLPGKWKRSATRRGCSSTSAA